MVTEIIKTEDFNSSYHDIDSWMEYGITDSAADICFEQWAYKNKNVHIYQYNHMRNKSYNNKIYINPLSKW